MGKIEDVAPRRTGRWLDASERALVIGVPLSLVDVSEEPKAAYGPRWVIEAGVMATGEVVLIGLGGTTKAKDGTVVDNGGRRAVLTAVQTALEDGESIDPVVLYRDGDGPNAPWVFRSATSAELRNPKAPKWPAAGPTDPVVIPGERLARAGKGAKAPKAGE